MLTRIQLLASIQILAGRARALEDAGPRTSPRRGRQGNGRGRLMRRRRRHETGFGPFDGVDNSSILHLREM